MRQATKMIMYGLAAIYGELTKMPTVFVLKQWEDELDEVFPDSQREQKKAVTTDADVAEVYAAYPTRDEKNNNRSLSKGAKSKQKIRSILDSGEYTKDDLLKLIKQEVECNQDTGKWLKDFNTFLNNLPELDDEPEEKPKEPSYRIW